MFILIYRGIDNYLMMNFSLKISVEQTEQSFSIGYAQCHHIWRSIVMNPFVDVSVMTYLYLYRQSKLYQQTKLFLCSHATYLCQHAT